MDVDEIFPRLTAYPALVDLQECGRSFATGKPQIGLVTNHRMKSNCNVNKRPNKFQHFAKQLRYSCSCKAMQTLLSTYTDAQMTTVFYPNTL